MGFVYLIKENGDDSTMYKIGMTKQKKIETRKKQLQTGNPDELTIKDYFETDKPYKLESMLHGYFENKKQLNEWFCLSENDVNNFQNICSKYQKIIDSLKSNPFFK